ncbi:MAG: hypothetical protein A2017_18250 [Lentisphaerae bacterium GWF2_44_16]|nr:MAG: hypothetical protein A2017_18250 [Lentisphaerae bacterium GWF2_44_16]
MSNVALHKKLEEEKNVRNPKAITDGDFTNYGPQDGYSAIKFPGYFTIDLEECHKIFCIRFLLWDGKETVLLREPRAYKYSLLISEDNITWKVLHNTDQGVKGWQEFKIPDGIKLRYIRVFALHNTACSEFHIVELEAYDDIENLPPLNKAPTTTITVNNSNIPLQTDAPLPIQKKFNEVISKLNDVKAHGVMDNKLIDELIGDMQIASNDARDIEQVYEAINRRIIGPIHHELKRSSKISKWSFWIGVISLFFAIILKYC